MANTKLPPTPTGVPPGHSFWNDWYERLRNIVNSTLVNHNDLQNIQGGGATERFHLTAGQHTDLTDGGDATSHFHASDRARANHTGTQDHNTTLSGLQGGTTGQYYHLTSAEYTGTGTGNFVRESSPALAGTPTAPTAAAGTNTTQVATTAHVFAERSNSFTLTNKTIALGSNTVSGTTAQFNTALTDGDFATLAGTETLTNKTINLANNTLTATSAQLAAALTDETGAGAAVFATSPTLVTPVLGAATATSLSSSGSITINGTGGLGYATGSGGAVTQITSRTTAVTLNKTNGAITLVSAAGTTAWQSFTVNNSTVAATDVIRVCQKSGTDLNQIHVTAVAAGSFRVTFATTGGTTVEQPVFNFAVIKAVAA